MTDKQIIWGGQTPTGEANKKGCVSAMVSTKAIRMYNGCITDTRITLCEKARAKSRLKAHFPPAIGKSVLFAQARQG